MKLQTPHTDQLLGLFSNWCTYTDHLSSLAYETQMKVYIGEDTKFLVKQEDMDFFYRTHKQLQKCLNEFSKEIENTIPVIISGRIFHIDCLKKLITAHNKITNYLNEDYEIILAKFEGVTYYTDPLKSLDLEKSEDDKEKRSESFDDLTDPLWSEYINQELIITKPINILPVLIKRITMSAEEFSKAAKIIYREITQSLVYNTHSPYNNLDLNVLIWTPNYNTTSKTTQQEEDKSLTATQKLLFIRLLQIEKIFPERPSNTDAAPELRAIALLTGVSYENQIKGSNGANVKVNLLLDDLRRPKMTAEQAKPKLKDLEAVENVARLLNITAILSLIDKYRNELTRIVANR